MKRLPVFLERERVTSAFVDDEDYPILSPLRWLLLKPPEYRGNHLTRRNTTDQFLEDLRDPSTGMSILRRSKPYTLVEMSTLDGKKSYPRQVWLNRVVLALHRDRTAAKEGIKAGHWRQVRDLGGRDRIIHLSGHLLDCRSDQLRTGSQPDVEGSPILEPPETQGEQASEDNPRPMDLDQILGQMSRPEGDSSDE